MQGEGQEGEIETGNGRNRIMSRRGNNEGSIYKRTDGRWAATVNLGWQGGKRKRKTFYGKTRRVVQEQLTAALRAQQQGLPMVSEHQTVELFLSRWLADSVKPRLKPRTHQSYFEIVRLHLLPSLGHISLGKLTPQQVQTLINDKLSSGLSPRRVEYIHAVLRSALSQAEKWGLIPRNVARLVEAPRVKHHEIEPFSPDEARCFVEAIRGERLEALYYLTLAVGVRQGEALGLSWSDVDLEGRNMTVRANLQRIDGEFLLEEPKSSRGRRNIPLPQPVVGTLRGHKIRQLQERLAAGPHWVDSGLVFTTELGGPLSDHHVRRRHYKILRKAGLRRQRFHDLRHAFASLMLAHNVHPRVVMETLGHSTFKLTMDTYSHVIPQVQREAADQMGEILGGL